MTWKRPDTYEEFSLTITCPSQCAHTIPKQSTAKQELRSQLEENKTNYTILKNKKINLHLPFCDTLKKKKKKEVDLV